ncbi:MFS general substrate transporter [Exidia glandulosa HHB12029]|uniref:MFS general substrate transporter n=1 Tax=Exidia glandulosa HHB12029 TaxID=1314781 RepID=A0A165EZ62_EXIGL|nr:MFS general substrate transporter [Exidia glandulosa HHB12029]
MAEDRKESVEMREEIASPAELGEYVPGSPEERALLRKIDLRVFPAVWIMYLMNYLDRSNIGNARVAGMEDDLSLTDNRYSIALLIFFVGYLLGEVPSNMILSRSRPSIYLPAIVCTWGVVAGLFATIQSYHGLIVARFFLGCIESGFFPGVMFFLSSWYRKAELAKRMAWFYSASMTSGAFGGLLAGGITEGLSNAHGIASWRWLFIIEGCMTVAVSIGCMFLLPDWPANTRWLTPAEQRLATLRIQADHIGSGGQRDLSHMEAFKAAVFEWRTYMFMFMYMMIVGAGTISYFIPTITTFLGYTGHTAQFMTVPIYAVALVFSLAISTSADYFNERPLHAGIPALIAALCFIIEASIMNNAARYTILCFGAAGIWTAVPIILAYLANTISYPHEKRAISQAIVNMFANLSSVYGSFLWPSDTAPRYAMGWATTAAMCFACGVSTILMGWLDKRYPYNFDYKTHNNVSESPVPPADSEKHRGETEHLERV